MCASEYMKNISSFKIALINGIKLLLSLMVGSQVNIIGLHYKSMCTAEATKRCNLMNFGIIFKLKIVIVH